jgi:hypothetical protein
MRLTDYLNESGDAAISGGDIAGFRAPMFSKPITRKRKKKYKLTEDKKVNDFSSVDVVSKLQGAEKANELKQDSVAYGIEDADGNITKVYVSKEQDGEFKQALSKILQDEDHVDVNEILFNLRNSFDILYVEWPKLPEDEEVDNVLDTKKDGDKPEGDVPPEGAEGELPAELPPAAPAVDDSSILLKVIDMLKADADSKTAEAKAKTAQAEAEQAKLTIQLTNTKVKNEEDMLRAEEHFKKQAEEKKEADRLAKLAKYRNEVTNTPTYEGVMDFNDVMNEDITANVNAIQTKIAAISVQKARASKLYDDQIRRLQQQLAMINKQATARGAAQPAQQTQPEQQPAQQGQQPTV